MRAVRIPYYTVRNGNGYWEPRGRMRLVGFKATACGPDGPRAWAKAEELNERWAKAKASGPTTWEDLSSMEFEGYVYFLIVGRSVKIGFSTNPFSRASQLGTGLSQKPTSIIAVRATSSDERRLHRRHAEDRLSGEWFSLTSRVRLTIAEALARGTESEVDSETSEKVAARLSARTA